MLLTPEITGGHWPSACIAGLDHIFKAKVMEKTFEEFMKRRYREAEKYTYGVTRAEESFAREAWELATLVA